MVAQWLVLEVPGSIPARGQKKIWCPNTLSIVSFAGMTLDKCIVLRIGTLTGCPLCRESHPLCRLKNPTVISIWLQVILHPGVYKVHLPIILERGSGSIYRKKDPKGVAKLLDGPNVHKASGPDGLNAKVLKECSNEISPILAPIYKEYLAWGNVPNEWLQANVSGSGL